METTSRWIAMLCFALAACASTPARAPQDVLDTLAAGGKLRVGVNVANPALGKRDAAGAITGISADLGRALAARLGVEAVLVPYPSPAALLEGGRNDGWDIAFFAIDPTRTDAFAFSTPYMEVSLSYVVPNASPIRTVADVDRAGVKVGVGERNAADLQLSRTLKNATLVRAPDNLPAAADLIRSGKVDAFGSNRQSLLTLQSQIPGQRITEGRFHVVQQGIAVPKMKERAIGYVSAFVEDMKANGTVAQSIARHSIPGVDVAPPAR